MLTLIQDAVQGYNNLLLNDRYADPITTKFFLISSPITMVIILGSYLYFCTKCGPKWMERRKPFELKKTIIVYNVVQILLSTYMALEGTVLWRKFNFWCELTDYTDTPIRRRIVNLCWIYFFAKITELMDTVLFVLRKKNNQISFLHLYHHTIMPSASWMGMRYVAGGHCTLFGVINSYVHIAMYTYYLIASLGPEYQKYLWWKRHLTEMQIIQFIIIFVHNIVPMFSSCTYPKWIHAIEIMFSSTFIYLFGDFYLKTYIYKKKNVENKNEEKKN